MVELHIKYGVNAKAEQVIISGVISADENNSADVLSAIEKASVSNPQLTVRLMNLYGGSVYEGLAIYNIIKERGLNTYAEGIVASMGSIIFCAGKERIMGKNATILTHKASTKAEGSAEAIETLAKQIKILDEQMAEVYAEATTMTKEEVVAKLMPEGKDVYLSASDALAMGIATRIEEGEVKAAAPKNILVNSNIKAVVAFYERQIKESNNTTMKNLPVFVAIAALNLTQNADEDKLLAAVQALAEKAEKLQAENEKYKADAKAAHEARVKALVSGAVKAGKITAKQEPVYMELATKDYDNTAVALEAIKVHESLSDQLDKQKAQNGEDRSQWSYADFQKKDPKALVKLKAENPDEFNRLKQEHVARLRNA